MDIFKRFFQDIKIFREYITNSIATEMAVKYGRSYLGYAWWVLDPLLYMLIYVFVVSIVLGRGGPDFPVFVFSGLLSFRWASQSISQCTMSITSKRNVIGNVYIPKFVFPFIKTINNSFFFLISIVLLFIFLLIYKIPLTFHIFEFIPIFIVQYLFNLAVGLWMSHLGVYFYDVDKVLNVFLRMWYYVSPGLYTLDTVPEALRPVLWLNPLTTMMVSSRNVFLYGESPVYLGLITWGLISIVIIYFGLKIQYKFDRTYAKVL